MRKIHPLVIVMGIEMLLFIGIAILISSQPDEEDFIIGDWVSNSEPEWTFQFDEETGVIQKPGSTSGAFNYVLTKDDSNCGSVWRATKNRLYYLTMYDKDGGLMYCYVVVRANETKLHLGNLGVPEENYYFTRR